MNNSGSNINNNSSNNNNRNGIITDSKIYYKLREDSQRVVEELDKFSNFNNKVGSIQKRHISLYGTSKYYISLPESEIDKIDEILKASGGSSDDNTDKISLSLAFEIYFNRDDNIRNIVESMYLHRISYVKPTITTSAIPSITKTLTNVYDNISVNIVEWIKYIDELIPNDKIKKQIVLLRLDRTYKNILKLTDSDIVNPNQSWYSIKEKLLTLNSNTTENNNICIKVNELLTKYIPSRTNTIQHYNTCFNSILSQLNSNNPNIDDLNMYNPSVCNIQLIKDIYIGNMPKEYYEQIKQSTQRMDTLESVQLFMEHIQNKFDPLFISKPLNEISTRGNLFNTYNLLNDYTTTNITTTINNNITTTNSSSGGGGGGSTLNLNNSGNKIPPFKIQGVKQPAIPTPTTTTSASPPQSSKQQPFELSEDSSDGAPNSDSDEDKSFITKIVKKSPSKTAAPSSSSKIKSQNHQQYFNTIKKK